MMKCYVQSCYFQDDEVKKLSNDQVLIEKMDCAGIDADMGIILLLECETNASYDDVKADVTYGMTAFNGMMKDYHMSPLVTQIDFTHGSDHFFFTTTMPLAEADLQETILNISAKVK